MNEFKKLKYLGISTLMKPGNINKNLFYIYRNNYFSHYINYINNKLLYNYNNYEFNNPLLSKYFSDNNFINLNNINNMINYDNKNNHNQENYTITFKSKTNNPNVKKISNIQITTSYIKDNLKKIKIGLQKMKKINKFKRYQIRQRNKNCSMF